MKVYAQQFHRMFLAHNALIVLVTASVVGVFLFLHWPTIQVAEILVAAALVFLLLPGFVYLLYLRFQGALEDATRGEASAFTEASERREELRSILDALVDPILTIDPRGTILTANPAVQGVFGHRPADLLGKDVTVLMAEPYRTEHQTYIDNYLRTGERKAIGQVRRVLGRRKSGGEFACELSVSEVKDSHGHRFVGIVRDISDREEMSARLAQAERLAAVGELAAGVAHEINNPINTVINCAQLIKDGDDDPTLADDIMQEGMRIAAIVRDLLDFARDHKPELVPTRLADVIQRTLSLVQSRLEKQGIVLRVDVPDDLPVIRARAQQLQQVFLNLLLNARDALTGEKRGADKAGEPMAIDLVARRLADAAGERIQVRVRDNGPGIDAKHLDRIFQPFFTTKRERGGTGLGLPVSLGIVKNHRGTLVAYSKLGGWAEFVVELPVDEPGWGSSAA